MRLSLRRPAVRLTSNLSSISVLGPNKQKSKPRATSPVNPLLPQRVAALVGAAVALLPLTLLAQKAQDAAREGYTAVQDLQIVDCLLPGQVRVVGGRTYLTPRRPARTTAANCRSAGGEYLDYDRADAKSALNVWMAAAQSGDAEAQTNVGEIYERGTGAQPDYQAAAVWYRKAAEQNYRRAQYDLGALYERGLGVPADPLEALNWYRRSWGLPADSVIWKTAATAEEEKLRSDLKTQIAQQDKEITTLREQVDELTKKLRAEGKQASDQIDVLNGLVARLTQTRDADSARLADLPPPAGAAPPAEGKFTDRESRTYHQKDFGRFFALIIGVQDYDKLEPLSSPLSDIAKLKAVLENRYGFSVKALPNPTNLALMLAVNELSCGDDKKGKDANEHSCLRDSDNLLIYFTGRGSRLHSGETETGYWLPTNADQPPNDTLWVPNDFITRHLGRIAAKRVLVISDSSYADLLASEPGLLMVGDGRYGDDYIQYKLPKRSRLLLASGGDQPVPDGGADNESVFAHALLTVLQTNDQVLTAPELYLRVRDQLKRSQSSSASIKEPELKAIKAAGHEVGDFFFVPG